MERKSIKHTRKSVSCLCAVCSVFSLCSMFIICLMCKDEFKTIYKVHAYIQNRLEKIDSTAFPSNMWYMCSSWPRHYEGQVIFMHL